MRFFSTLKVDLREFFLLEQAERRFDATPPAQRAIVAEHLRAAKRRLRFAPSLVDAQTAPVALTMARDALALLIRAHWAAVRGAELDAESLRGVDTAGELTRLLEAASSPPEGWRTTLPLLRSSDPLEIDRLDAAQQDALAATFARTARWLQGRIETNSRLKIRVARVLRWATPLILAIYIIAWASAAPNLALHRPVSQSSRWPASTTSSALVDGETSGMNPPGPDSDFVHTNREVAPWVMVDLGAAHTLRQIRIYNRNDGSFDDGLPYTVELSQDGRAFDAVAQRKTHFGSTWFDRPWTVRLDSKPARFVRVRATSYLALSELEVYGR